jgi:hypothetical protein
MIHMWPDLTITNGTSFKCALCGKFGFFLFYPQVHKKCFGGEE